MQNYEDTFTLDELRREVRRCWDAHGELTQALLALPEVPSIEVLRTLTDAAMSIRDPDVKALGIAMQKYAGPSLIPYKTEYECAAGLWALIRRGILEGREAKST